MAWKHVGKVEVYFRLFLSSALDRGERSGSRFGLFTLSPPGRPSPSPRWVGNWVGRRAVLDTSQKREVFCPCKDTKHGSSTAQPVTHWLSSPAKRTEFLHGNFLAIARWEERNKTYIGYIYPEENFLSVLSMIVDDFRGHFWCGCEKWSSVVSTGKRTPPFSAQNFIDRATYFTTSQKATVFVVCKMMALSITVCK
jgi:hypothetical protein